MAKQRSRTAPKPSANGGGATVLNVSYGNVNVGEKTARLACSMSRDLAPGQVDKLLVGRRLTVECLVRAAGGSEQAGLPGMAEQDTVIRGVADSKTVGLAVKSYTFGLTFGLKDVEIDDLARFAKRHGQVTIQSVADIPAEERDGAADETEE